MRVLVACEFSGVVREAFRKRGHIAFSCDLFPAKDREVFWHLCADVSRVLRYPELFNIYKPWDLMIAHPPCTFLSNMSNCRIKKPGRMKQREDAMGFFLALAGVDIPKIAIENPRGYPERAWRPADQIIHPYEFGHPQSKATCLWLKNLPLLKPTNVVEPQRTWDGKRYRTFVDGISNWRGDAARVRSITFQGIADAMAEQWGQ